METNKISKLATSISLKVVGIIFISFLLGFSAYGLFQNLFGKENISFSTIGLIGFALTTLLAGASIVLAISAIMLGKFSEQAMIQRSDESIRLQNEVFQKTTDALQRIESSTGVTEKRIEDIISGRVGDISYKIAEIATESRKGKSKRSFEEIEEEIRSSIMQSLEKERFNLDYAQRQEARKKREEEEKKKKEEKAKEEKIYQGNHQIVLRAFANRNDLKVIKTYHGSPWEEGDDIFDGIYKMENDLKIAVSTFRSDIDPEFMKEYIPKALNELKKSNVTFVYTFLFEENEKIKESFDELVNIASEELKNKIKLIIAKPSSLEIIISDLTFS